jgi:curved DNA-binding protein CbpA
VTEDAAVSDPYEILGLGPDSDDAAIRARYLELVRQFPPEKHPEQFAAVRQAYDSLRDLDTRLHHRLFEAGKKDTIEAVVEELACRSSRRRLPLETLLKVTAQR